MFKTWALEKVGYYVGAWLGAIFLGAAFVVSKPCLAADGQVGIQIAPLIMEYSAEPGDELVGQVLLFNPLDQPQTTLVKTWDFSSADELGNLRFLDKAASPSASHWFLYQPDKISLSPKEQYIMPFTIRVPRASQPGTHTAVIFAQVAPKTEDQTSGSAVNVAAGTLFLIDVMTPESAQPQFWTGRVLETKIFGLRPIFGLPINWVTDQLTGLVRFENTGLYQQRILGKMRLGNFLGQEIELGQPLNQRVLANSVIQFRYSGQPTWLLGYYQLRAEMAYGRSQEQTATQTMTFWAINSRGLFLLVLIVLSLFFVINRGRLLPRA